MLVNDSPSKGSDLPGDNERGRRGPQWTWLHRIPAIINSLEQLPLPVVDRSVVEDLFQLQRRQARNLMLRFKPFQRLSALHWSAETQRAAELKCSG
jgi:hypothetical protein